MTPRPLPRSFRHPGAWLLGLLAVFAISGLLPSASLFAAPEDYLPLHSALEFFSISVAAMVFALGLNLRHTERGGRLAWLGAVFLAVGLLDFAHTLSYAGMPDFITPNGTEKAIHFWLAGRTLAALTLLWAALWPPSRSGTASQAERRLGLLAVLLLVGIFIEPIPAMVMLVPVLQPIGDVYGLEPYHFAMVVTFGLLLGSLTPPVAVLVLITCKIANVDYMRANRPLIPIFVMMVVALVLIAFIPAITLVFPRWMAV